MLSVGGKQVGNDLLEATIASIKQVLQIPISIGEPHEYGEKSLHSAMCVLVGFTGDVEGRLLIDANEASFGGLGSTMFGMAMEGEMLHSFVGEVANMLAGNICTSASQKGWKIDITPPTIMMGELKWFGLHKGCSIPVTLQNIGDIRVILLVQEEKAV